MKPEDRVNNAIPKANIFSINFDDNSLQRRKEKPKVIH
jgi:hypothetical protein